LPTTASSWRHLHEISHNLTGFSSEALEEMHDYLYDNEEEHRGAGRPRLLNNRDELGLILFYFGPSMKYSKLCLLFGCTPTQCSAIINYQLTFPSRDIKIWKLDQGFPTYGDLFQ
jgi:hypothetical protein